MTTYTSPLLTAEEASAYLRFDEDGRDMDKAVRSLTRLVEQRQIKPCSVGGRNRFAVWELDRFIRERTEESA